MYRLIDLFLSIVFSIGVCSMVSSGCKTVTDRFTLLSIQPSKHDTTSFVVRPLSIEEKAELKLSLSEKYFYLSSGGQCFAFISESGKYVIKFPKQNRFKPSFYFRWIPFRCHFLDQKWEQAKTKLDLEYRSYQIGFEQLISLTGLIYVHLHPTCDLKKKLTLVDALQIEHLIDLDTTHFLIQKYANPPYETISKLVSAGLLEEAQKIITKLLKLVILRCQKGYSDSDSSFKRNCGILNGEAIKIDVGKFVPNEKMKTTLFTNLELYHIATPLRHWLYRKQPELAFHLDNEIFQFLESGEFQTL